ncbi:MAG TPA: response regulator transcription factor [Actinomycetota bacterium]|nr:response regulator transcription factor [Actinomycetota bacterium]
MDAVRPTLLGLGAEDIVVAYTGSDGVAAAKRSELDVALVDIGLPDRSGLSVGREIMDLDSRTLVVALTAVKDALIARHALKLGFAAYLPKDISLDIFAQGMRNVLRGRRIDLSSAGSSTSRRPSRTEPWREGSDLTGRELEVLSLLVEGCTGPTIATRLGISRNTVRTHIQSILTKVQVHSRLQAVAFAVEEGLVDVSSRGAIDARRAAGQW